MKYVNRRDLEDGLFCFQREDVLNKRRWYVSYKLKGYRRVYKALGEMSSEQAEKLSRRELMQAEQTLDEFGDAALLGKNTIGDAYSWFLKNGAQYVSKYRYDTIRSNWKNHWLEFFGKKTVIDRRLQSRMAVYVEWRRRVVNRKTGERRHAATSTIRHEITSAKQLLKMAREHAGIGTDFGNLTLKLNKDKVATGKSKSTTFQDEEIEQLKAFFHEDAANLQALIGKNATAELRLFYLERLRFFVALALASGARVNELRQVRVGDFENDFKILSIRKSKTSKGSGRKAFLDNEIWDIKEAFNRFMNFYSTKSKNGLVFLEKTTPGESSLGAIGQTFGRFLKKHRMLYEKKHGKRKRDFFATRHYFITNQVNKDVSAYVVATSCGTSLKMIQATYYETDGTQLVKKFEEKGSRKSKKHLTLVK